MGLERRITRIQERLAPKGGAHLFFVEDVVPGESSAQAVARVRREQGISDDTLCYFIITGMPAGDGQ